MQFASHLQARDARVARASLLGAVGLMLCASSAMSPRAWAQQVMWKDNPISGKVVGLTYGTSSWTAGEAQAVAYGGHLAAVRSEMEQAWLVQEFAPIWGVGSNGGGPWIGFTDAAQENQWVWVDGSPTTWTNWAPGEPNNCCGGQDFANMNDPASQWRWDDGGIGSLRSLVEVSQRPPRSWSWPEVVQLGEQPHYSHVLDVDDDGDLDVAVPRFTASAISLLINDGAGRFTRGQDIGGCSNVRTVKAIDWNSDGKQDLVFAAGEANYLGCVLRIAPGVFGSPFSVAPVPYCHGIDVADMNGDGIDDVLTTSWAADSLLRVHLRSATGAIAETCTFQPPLGGISWQPTAADVNSDGFMDVLVAGGNASSFCLYLGGSAVPFNLQLLPSQPQGTSSLKVVVADLLGDKRPEIVSLEFNQGMVRIWRWENGTLVLLDQLAVAQGPYWADAADVDGDGRVDLVVASRGASKVEVYRSTSAGLALDHSLAGDGQAGWVALADFNGDRKPDVVSDGFNGQFLTSLNQSIFDCNANGIDDPLDISSGAATDCNANGRPDSCDLAFGISQDSDGDGIINECEPTLVSITPNTLPAFVGGTVTIRSTNIPNGTVRLDLGGTPLPFTMTDNVGTVTIPPLTAARSSDLTTAATLAFLGPNGPEVTGALAAALTWDVPEITAATPGSAPYDQATGVAFTLEDSTLLTATGTAIFGNAAPQAAYLITVNGHSKVITTAPPQAAPGPVSVLLRLGNEQALAERGFVYLGPGITATSVSNGWQAGGEPLTLELVDFVPNVPVEVRLGTGTTTGTPSGLLAASTLVVTTPYTAAPGVVDLELVQNAGQPNEKRVLSPGAWLADAPLVVGATPANAYQGGGDAVSVNVAGFVPGIAARVQIGSSALGYASVDATVVGTLDAAAIAFTMPLAPFAGLCDLVVTQAAGTPNELRATSAGAFTVVGASIASLSPTSGPLEGGTTVVVQTSGFQEGVPAQVTLGGTTVAGLVAGSGANQTVTFRTTLAAASGPTAVDITQGVFNAVLPAGYSFDAPRVVRFCAAKITGQGTLPVIGWTGAPSATTGDFAITLSSALPNKTAQYFYGDSNNNFFPFFGGTLCVAVNVTRGPLSSTNASSAASVPFPVNASLIGRKRYFQWWFRDPLDPAGFGRGLSDGLEVEFYN